MATRKRSPKRHEEEVKAKVIARLGLGDGVMEIARDLRLPHSTVSTYKAELAEDVLDAIRRKKGELLEEAVYEYMMTSLTTLRKQAEMATDAKYIKRYSPESLAILHGVLADKTVRLLEATTRARTEPRRISDGGGESQGA